MPGNKLHEVIGDLLRTDSALFLRSRPPVSVPELVDYLDELADVQAALDDVRRLVRGRLFAERSAEDRALVAPGALPSEAGSRKFGRPSVSAPIDPSMASRMPSPPSRRARHDSPSPRR